MSYSKMLLPLVIYMLHCWSIFWMTITPTVTSSACPSKCKCMWKGGKNTAECTSSLLTAIPTGIDVTTQVLNVSFNNLQSLPKEVFLDAKLVHLQRIYLSNCSIDFISDDAFTPLTNLVELDLSNNHLAAIPTAAFKAILDLSRLYLSGNPIHRIDNNAFAALSHLTILELSRCHLETVAPKAFHGLKSLVNLKLDVNRLTTLSAKSIQPLRGLHAVYLHGNPWKCDCSMQAVKEWLEKYNIPRNLPPTCAQPPRLKGSSLDQLPFEELACQPQSLYSNRRIQVNIGRNASLACEVTGNPSPTIQWLRHGHPLVNLTRFFHGAQMYVIHERGNTDKVSILTITRVTEQDSGVYVCVATNNGGTFAANFTLDVTYLDLEASGLSSGQIAGISLGLILLAVIVLLLICILLAKWRQANRGDSKHPPLNQSQHKLMNSVNHVDYKGEHKNKNSVRMSFSLPRLSRSNSTQRNNSDDASDSDRTLIENLTSPSKSSTCNLSNKPDVVNVERNTSSQNRSKKDKETRKKDKRQKDKRKDRHRWKDGVDHPKEDNKTWENKDNRCNSVMPSSRSKSKLDDDMETLKSHLRSEKKVFEDDNRYGSYGNLKLSASSEWNKVANEMIENAGFARDHEDGTQESYELIDKAWVKSNHCADHQEVVSGGGCNTPLNKIVVSPVSPTTAVLSVVDNGGVKNTSVNTLSRNSNARFRHYVPVLPPLPAHHYSHVRNSLIRTSTDSSEDITDM